MQSLEVMKVSQSFKMFVPTSIKNSLLNYLKDKPPRFKYNVFDFYFIINYLLYKQLYAKDSENFFPLNYKYLNSVISKRTDSYIKYLLNGDFINRDFYIKGERPYHYKLNPKFEMDLNTIPVEPGTKLFERMQRKTKNKKAHYNRLEPHLKTMKDKFMNIKFDSDLAMKFISDIPDLKKQLAYKMQIEYLADNRLRYFARNNVNKRLDTNITNLKSVLRNFLIGDFTHIDLKNSQPFFLNQLISNIISKQRESSNTTLICCDYLGFDLVKVFGYKSIKLILKSHQKQKKSNLVNLKKFGEAVNSGILYDSIIEHFNNQYSRDEVKGIIFKVLFSNNVVYKEFKRFVPYKDEKKVFANVFPFIAETLKTLKIRNHKDLPIFLTKMESYIFIDCISKKLVSAGIVPITIHDSVIVETKHTQQALEIIHSVFLEHFGVIPALHVNKMNTMHS